MLTNWISPEALKSLNDGVVVAITLEAKEGQADASFSVLPLFEKPAAILCLRALRQRGRLGRA